MISPAKTVGDPSRIRRDTTTATSDPVHPTPLTPNRTNETNMKAPTALDGPGKAAPDNAPKANPESPDGCSTQPMKKNRAAGPAVKTPTHPSRADADQNVWAPSPAPVGHGGSQASDAVPAQSEILAGNPAPGTSTGNQRAWTATLRDMAIAGLHPAPANAKTYVPSIDELSKSAEISMAFKLYFGLAAHGAEAAIIRPPLVDASGTILLGHNVVESARAAGLSAIKVIQVSLR